MALNGQPLINGVRHSWSSIKLNMLARTVTGITEIKYGDTVDIVDQKGAGSFVSHRGYGSYEATCSLKLAKFEIDGIEKAAPSLRIQEIPPFDIVVAYLKEGDDGQIIDTIRNCQFKSNPRDTKSGDTTIDVPVEIICSHIERVHL